MTNHKISLFSVSMISLTCMIGSGWLFAPMISASVSGNYSFFAWIVAAIFIMCVAYCFSTLFIEYPYRGITTRICSITHNKLFGLPFAFVNWFGIIACVSTEAQATTQYLSPYLGHAFIDSGALTFYGKSVGFLFLCLYLLVNYYGVKLFAKINNVVTALKFLTPIIVLVVLFIAYFSLNNFDSSSINKSYNLSSVPFAIVAAGMIYAFNGFQAIGSFASEIKNPKRNIPLALFISISIALVFYLIVQLVFMGVVPHNLIINGWASLNFVSPMIDVTTLLGLHIISLILVINSILAPSATGYTYLGSSSRMLYGMAKEKQAPKFLLNLCPKHNFSKSSMLINFLIAVLFLYSSSGWGDLVIIVTMYNIYSYMSAPISMGSIGRNRVFGCFVLVFICFIISATPKHDILITNESLTILLLVFLSTSGLQNLKRNIISILPFYSLIWGIWFFNYWYSVIILSILFYLIVVNKGFVNFCKSTESIE